MDSGPSMTVERRAAAWSAVRVEPKARPALVGTRPAEARAVGRSGPWRCSLCSHTPRPAAGLGATRLDTDCAPARGYDDLRKREGVVSPGGTRMSRLSSSITDLPPRAEVVVVGSGYGAAIAASRLARAGRDVVILERGREFRPGEYPDTPAKAAGEMQFDLPEPDHDGRAHVGSPTGLYDFRVNKDINVFVGCGLGGTSLVNANVSLRAEPRVFLDPAWPAAIREDGGASLEPGYKLAEQMLKPVPLPEGSPALPKLAALEKMSGPFRAGVAGARFYRPPINVNFDVSGDNHVGVHQEPCNGCGDCVTGCNTGAKNTLLMNYLPDAWNHGARIFTEVSVRWIERKPNGWLVRCHLLGLGREAFDAPTFDLEADVVILGAGTLGSTEILLRSREHGLALSDRLGRGFTGNGDALGFAYNCDEEVRGVGWARSIRRGARSAPASPGSSTCGSSRGSPTAW